MTYETLCIILLIIACIVSLLVLWYKVQKEGLRKTIIDLILVAEKSFSAGRGTDKMDYVIGNVLNILPTPIKGIITIDMVEKFIQNIFDEIKEVLEYGTKN